MYYFVYCNNCAFKDVNGSCYCTYWLVALCVPEICFWPAKTIKKLYLFEMHICVWPGAQTRFRHKWSKLVAGSLLLQFFDGCSCLGHWNEFLSAMFQVLDWSCLLLQFDRNVCNWIPKVIWPRMDWFWCFLLANGFLRWLQICIDWSLQDLLNCFSFLTTSSIVNFKFEGYCGLFSKNACTF